MCFEFGKITHMHFLKSKSYETVFERMHARNLNRVRSIMAVVQFGSDLYTKVSVGQLGSHLQRALTFLNAIQNTITMSAKTPSGIYFKHLTSVLHVNLTKLLD